MSVRAALPASPADIGLRWPLAFSRTAAGMAPYAKPSRAHAEAALLRQGRCHDAWQRNAVVSLPRGKEWTFRAIYPDYPLCTAYLARNKWLPPLAASHLALPRRWKSELAARLVTAYLDANPFPVSPFPPQPLAFGWVAHLALDVFVRIWSWMDAWAAGLFAASPAGREVWERMGRELDAYAGAWGRLPTPRVKRGNHYLTEHGIAPAVLAALRPMHPAAGQLRAHGCHCIRGFLARDVFADGAYIERCLPYTMAVTRQLMFLEDFDRANGLGILDAKGREKLRRHAVYFLNMMDASGSIFPFGDGSRGAVGGLQGWVRRRAGGSFRKQAAAHYPDPGLCVLRKGGGEVALALQGKCLDNYHQHYDVLAVLVTLDGVPLVDDPEGGGYLNEHGAKGEEARRRVRHHRYSARAHNIPCPKGRNRPTLAEYGTGYYGRGKWKDLGGMRQFWGGRPPRSRGFRVASSAGRLAATASCSMFPPASHTRELVLGRDELVVRDRVARARGHWTIVWCWGTAPRVMADGTLRFRTPRFEVQASFRGRVITGKHPFLRAVLGKRSPKATVVRLTREGTAQCAEMRLVWKRREPR